MTHLIHDPEFWVLVAAVIFVIAVFKPASAAIILGPRRPRPAHPRRTRRGRRNCARRPSACSPSTRPSSARRSTRRRRSPTHAKEEAERIAAQAARDLEQSLERRQRLAEERIAQAEAKAVAEIRAAAVDVAIAAARNVIAGSLDDSGRARLIEAAIQALPQGAALGRPHRPSGIYLSRTGEEAASRKRDG